MFTIRLRKKLITTIVGTIITLIIGVLALRGIDVPEEMKLELVKYLIGAVTAIVGLFNVGQGIADIGKEKPKP